MTKNRYTFTLDDNAAERLKQIAEWNNRSASNQLETMIKEEYIRLAPIYASGLEFARKAFKQASEGPDNDASE